VRGQLALREVVRHLLHGALVLGELELHGKTSLNGKSMLLPVAAWRVNRHRTRRRAAHVARFQPRL
jgi:hypothetical protein